MKGRCATSARRATPRLLDGKVRECGGKYLAWSGCAAGIIAVCDASHSIFVTITATRRQEREAKWERTVQEGATERQWHFKRLSCTALTCSTMHTGSTDALCNAPGICWLTWPWTGSFGGGEEEADDGDSGGGGGDDDDDDDGDFSTSKLKCEFNRSAAGVVHWLNPSRSPPLHARRGSFDFWTDIFQFLLMTA